MTDFETKTAGTADLVKRLRDVEFKLCREAADRIEQLEAALTRANAAAAAAYEVAAKRADNRWALRKEHADRIYEMDYREAKIDAKTVSAKADEAQSIADEIRALATPDQTAALDKLIAEAVDASLKQAAFWVEEAMVIVAPDGVPQRMALDSYRKQFSALITASKKGGV